MPSRTKATKTIAAFLSRSTPLARNWFSSNFEKPKPRSSLMCPPRCDKHRQGRFVSRWWGTFRVQAMRGERGGVSYSRLNGTNWEALDVFRRSPGNSDARRKLQGDGLRH